MFVLKQLRRKKKINQTDLAGEIGVSLRTIQLYEKRNANIPIKNLTKIADYFEMTIAELYSHEVNEKEGIYEVKSQKSKYFVKPINLKKSILSIPLVTIEKHSQYCKNFQNQDFFNELPTISFMIGDYIQGNYTAFENAGNSMKNGSSSSIPNGAVVLGKEISLDNLKTKENIKNLIMVIVYEESILCKELIDFDKKREMITCHSLNNSPEYSDFMLHLKDVKQIFQILKKQV